VGEPLRLLSGAFPWLPTKTTKAYHSSKGTIRFAADSPYRLPWYGACKESDRGGRRLPTDAAHGSKRAAEPDWRRFPDGKYEEPKEKDE